MLNRILAPADAGSRRTSATVAIVLGVTQTIGYGSLYYAFGVLAAEMAADTGYSLTTVFGLFSLSLLTGGAAAPYAGRLLDRHHPGLAMASGSLAAALVLALWAAVPGKAAFAVLSVAVGVVSVLVLYEAAFVAAARLCPVNARRTITGITLIAGFASTIFWPLTSALAAYSSWRGVYLTYAGLNALVCIPLHLFLMRYRPAEAHEVSPDDVDDRTAGPRLRDPYLRRKAFMLLLVGFAANAFVISAVHLHLIGLLGGLGLGGSAALIGAFIGPSQVAGRLVEFVAGDRFSVFAVAILSAAALPLALVLLGAGAPVLAFALGFAVLFGIGQGLAYIVRGVLPLALFGTAGYGALTGKINAVRLFVSAAAPFLAAALFDRAGAHWTIAMIAAVAVLSTLALARLVPLARSSR